MKALRTSIPDVLIIEPDVFWDDRGCIFESWNGREPVNAEAVIAQANMILGING